MVVNFCKTFIHRLDSDRRLQLLNILNSLRARLVSGIFRLSHSGVTFGRLWKKLAYTNSREMKERLMKIARSGTTKSREYFFREVKNLYLHIRLTVSKCFRRELTQHALNPGQTLCHSRHMLTPGDDAHPRVVQLVGRAWCHLRTRTCNRTSRKGPSKNCHESAASAKTVTAEPSVRTAFRKLDGTRLRETLPFA
jgi:hypothetical protein